MKKQLFILLLATSLLSTSAWAQSVPAVLSSADVTRFTESFESLFNDLVKLDGPYAAETVDVESMQSFWNDNAQYKAILQKYGWDASFPQKFFAIQMAFGFLTNQKEAVEGAPPGAEGMIKRMIAEQRAGLEREVNPADIATVEEQFEALSAAMDF